MIGTHYTGHFVTNIFFILNDINENRIILSFAFTYLHVEFEKFEKPISMGAHGLQSILKKVGVNMMYANTMIPMSRTHCSF